MIDFATGRGCLSIIAQSKASVIDLNFYFSVNTIKPADIVTLANDQFRSRGVQVVGVRGIPSFVSQTHSQSIVQFSKPSFVSRSIPDYQVFTVRPTSTNSAKPLIVRCRM
jgi:hypothetical protein